MGSKPKTPKPSAQETLLQQQQVADLIALDVEENRRLKRMVGVSRAGRAFRAGPSVRAAPRDEAARGMTGGRPVAAGGAQRGTVGGRYGGRSLLG